MKKVCFLISIKKIEALVLLIIVFLLPLSAHSEIKAGSFELSPFVGYNFFEEHQNLKNRPLFGARFGYNVTQYFGIELSGEFVDTKVDDKTKTGLAKGEFGSPMDGVDITLYNVDVLYHFMPDGNFNPYITAGVGGTSYSPSISTKDMATINFGLGAKAWLTDNIALRVDFRDYLVSELFDDSYHNLQATLGIVFAFGGRTKTAPTAVVKYEPSPEPEKVEAPIVNRASEVKAEEKVVILAFEDVHFDFDKSILTKEAQVILNKSIRLLKDNPKAAIRISGYASASGSEEYNQKLSERRARAVYDYLTKEGLILPERLITIGYGEMRPERHEPIPEDKLSKEAKMNMRVLIEVIEK